MPTAKTEAVYAESAGPSIRAVGDLIETPEVDALAEILSDTGYETTVRQPLAV